MDIHRDWNARYVWPRFVSGIPRDFFAAVRAELEAEGRKASPQTRDMNPVYTGKDVSYIDTKQAQRYGETLLADAEAWATLASLVTGHPYPDAALDKAWRQLVYGAHHDAITGSESDQVYIDLLTGWRELADLAETVHADATKALADRVEPGTGPDLVVFNPATWERRDVLTVADPGLVPVGDDFQPLPAVREEDGTLRVVVPQVPGTGLKALPLAAGSIPEWTPGEGTTIRNEFYEVTVDPVRGGAVSSLRSVAEDRELLPAGDIGNELVVQEEFARHPRFGEGPWHLTPTGTTAARSRDVPADIDVDHSPAGLPHHRPRRPRAVQVHPAPDPVDRRGPARRLHDDRRLRRRGPPDPRPLALRRAGRTARARGRRRGDRAGLRLRGGQQRGVPLDAGQPGQHLVRARFHGPGRAPGRLRGGSGPTVHRGRRVGVRRLGRGR